MGFGMTTRAEAVLRLIIREMGEGALVRISPPSAVTGKLRACPAAQANKGTYTAWQAPALPLVGCDNPSGCICVYSVDLERSPDPPNNVL